MEPIANSEAVFKGWDLLILIAWVLLTPELLAAVLRATFHSRQGPV